ncbi:MAG: cyclic nucleotide-binding domain-containing protein [Phaeodactylibacter sp.]|uniref:Crp/Fnr family transcriptional regulator n=1 Tax=Phaeodactylibacter sp. TaxID=1940289 RepID=UPI0032EEE750
MGLLQNISLQWDLWIGKYRAFFVTEAQDREACEQLLNYDGNRKLPVSGQWVACQDTRRGEIIACLVLSDAEDRAAATADAFGYVEAGYMPRLAVITHLSFDSTYLNTPAVPVLLSHCFVEVLKADGLALLMHCDPGHYSIYKRLGMRPIGPLQMGEGGDYQIPMIGLPDMEYLSVIHSPMLPMLRGVSFDRYQDICDWYYQVVREHKELQTGTAFYPEDDQDFQGHHAITEGLSEDGKAAFLKDAMIITCRQDEVLFAENDTGKSIGYVRKGLLRVEIGGQTVVMLGEGDLFGEIAYILNTKRTAKIVSASPETEVVLFQEKAIDLLVKESDRTVIWRNLAKVLAQRVVVTSKLLK